MDWLKKIEASKMDHIDILRTIEVDGELNGVIEWRWSMLEEQRLGEDIGKAVMKVWVYGNLNNSKQIGRAFRLGLKYYMMREKGFLSVAKEIEKLCATRFCDMFVWAECDNRFAIDIANLGVAFAILRQLDDCINCFQARSVKESDRVWVWRDLGDAYM